MANSTFPCRKILRPLRANSSLLGFQRAGHSLNGDETGWGTGTWLTFSFSWYFFHWLKQQLLFGGPCSLTMTQAVSEFWSGHLQIGQCDITSLESDFYCPDCPCESKTGPGIEELFILTCRHSSFLQAKEERYQDYYHWSLGIGWSRVALIQLIHSFCSHHVRFHSLPTLTLATCKSPI